ncbi:MAG TPA: hypothetical protein PK668_20890 [Myxococcota bacterium]|nr:hypothetical protein [Myxococcota bacterium]HRY96631.1 hypothetical protein [Myxococcota bacterium]HSA24037.1 hypothetical protein [Myxococcota bacterium]
MSDATFQQQTGISGVHFTAARLTYLGFHAVPTIRNAHGPDLLVSNLDGSKLVSIQVKTTGWAARNRGRGEARKLDHYEWEIGWKNARLDHRRLFFALVDLKDFQELPDIFIVPSKVIFEYFDGGDPTTWTRARYHPEVAIIEPYKNNWDLLRKAIEE